MNNVTTKISQAKIDAVAAVSEGLKNNKTMAIVSYQGLTVAELTELRRKLAEKDAYLGVYKNTLVGRALKENNVEGLESYLEGPNAFVFSKDTTAALPVLVKFARYHDKLVLRGGLVEGTVVDEKGLKEVAKLPSKEALLSMFCMVLNEPVAQFARAVKAVAGGDEEADGAEAAPAEAN